MERLDGRGLADGQRDEPAVAQGVRRDGGSCRDGRRLGRRVIGVVEAGRVAAVPGVGRCDRAGCDATEHLGEGQGGDRSGRDVFECYKLM